MPLMPRITLDTPIDDLEFSVRVARLLAMHGCRTLRDAQDKLEHMKNHAKGWGRKCEREVREMLDEAERPNMFNDPQYVFERLEEDIGQLQALMHDVDLRLLRTALKRRISREARGDLARKLRHMAEVAERLPLPAGEN